MKRVLITGMSGTGKTSVIRELLARGNQAHDLDTAEWSHWVAAAPGDDLTPGQGEDWVWQLDKVEALLSRPTPGPLFVSGCAENMPGVLHLFDAVVLLSAPLPTILARLAARTGSGYGHTEEERRKVAELIGTIEPLLRQSADFEIDTRQPVQATVDALLRFIELR
ncbi:shikimate kinase [Labrys sp. LIt4]|uniref:AAA family ATPase n=1 Tax=Labrys sp. LIt4 TaxID=2821355 RepID=UPI001AE017DE|nr:AAA family ATPase [Labrys sp. LIt4]MBP0583150.1 shikimate kinase [Labrys sp. LIt4]